MVATKIYFASPLFTEMEQFYNALIVDAIYKRYDNKVAIYLPQNNEEINNKEAYADSIMIANGDNAHLEEADLLIAVLDGQTMDVGVAAEIGYFFSTGKPILALYSDTRQGTHGNKQKVDALDVIAESQFSYVNLYVIGLVKQRGTVVGSSKELIDCIEGYLKEDV